MSRRRVVLALTGAAVVWTALFLAVTPGHLPGKDGYFHIKMAWMYRQAGPLAFSDGRFPWTQASVFRDHYADKSWLFHVLLSPLTLGWDEGDYSEADPSFPHKLAFAGADTLEERGKLAVVLLQLAVFLALFWALRDAGAPLPGVLVLGLFFGADFLWWRLSMCRPQLVSVVCLLVGFRLAATGRRWPLFILGTLYALAYTASHALVVLVGLVAVTRLALGAPRRDALVPLAFATGGVALGFVVHPNAANNLGLFLIQNASVLGTTRLAPLVRPLLGGLDWEHTAGRTIMESAWELEPPPLLDATVGLWTLWVPLALVLVPYVTGRRRPSARALPALVVLAAWIVMFAAGRRFFEYTAPFAVLAMGLCLADHLEAGHKPGRLVVAVLALAALAGGYKGWDAVSRAGPPPERAVAQFLAESAEEDDLVFTTSWSGTAPLFHYDHHRRYLVVLDPHFMLHFAPEGRRPGEVFAAWTGLVAAEDVVDGRPWREALESIFAPDWVLCHRRSPRLCERLLAEGAEQAYGDETYRLVR